MQKGPDLGFLVSGHLEFRPSATGLLDKAGWLPLNAVPGCTETWSSALDLVDGKTVAGWVGRAPCGDPSSGGKMPGVLKLALTNRGQAPDPAGCSLPAGSAGPAQLETMALASASRRKQLMQEDQPGAGAGVTARGLGCIQTPQLAAGPACPIIGCDPLGWWQGPVAAKAGGLQVPPLSLFSCDTHVTKQQNRGPNPLMTLTFIRLHLTISLK